MVQSVARDTLAKAKCFLADAVAEEASSIPRRRKYTRNLEAAILYAHAVWDHLRAEFRRRQNFDAWKQQRWATLNAQPLYSFISKKGDRKTPRNKIGLRHRLEHFGGNVLSLSGTLRIFIQQSMQVSLVKTVIRSQPWYKRSWNIWWNDISRPVKEWMNTLQLRVSEYRSQTRTSNLPPIVQRTFYFDDPHWNTIAASTVVQRYIDLMEKEIDAWEAYF